MIKLRYLFIVTLTLTLMTSGCSTKEVATRSETKSIILPKAKKVAYIYKKNFSIKYTKERIVWFAPFVTKEGDVISERTVSILPKFPTWKKSGSQLSDYKVSQEIVNFLKDDVNVSN